MGDRLANRARGKVPRIREHGSLRKPLLDSVLCVKHTITALSRAVSSASYDNRYRVLVGARRTGYS